MPGKQENIPHYALFCTVVKMKIEKERIVFYAVSFVKTFIKYQRVGKWLLVLLLSLVSLFFYTVVIIALLTELSPGLYDTKLQ